MFVLIFFLIDTCGWLLLLRVHAGLFFLLTPVSIIGDCSRRLSIVKCVVVPRQHRKSMFAHAIGNVCVGPAATAFVVQ